MATCDAWGSIRRPMRCEPAALTTSLPQVMWHLANGWYNGTWNSLMSVLTCQWGNGSHVLFTDWMSQLLPSTRSSRPALFGFEIAAAAGTLSQNRQRAHGPEEHACKPREQPSDRPPPTSSCFMDATHPASNISPWGGTYSQQITPSRCHSPATMSIKEANGATKWKKMGATLVECGVPGDLFGDGTYNPALHVPPQLS